MVAYFFFGCLNFTIHTKNLSLTVTVTLKKKSKVREKKKIKKSSVREKDRRGKEKKNYERKLLVLLIKNLLFINIS